MKKEEHTPEAEFLRRKPVALVLLVHARSLPVARPASASPVLLCSKSDREAPPGHAHHACTSNQEDPFLDEHLVTKALTFAFVRPAGDRERERWK
jgi:hypothetical protein